MDDLMVFVSVLRSDLNEQPDAWANSHVAGYLESIAASSEGSLNKGDLIVHEQRWAEIADALFAGRIYE
ncbi:hypothetical protein [Micromonospora sp. NBC_01638]|uniref:DUF7660 family protein n=1 Tax=Micromonospora sp. NBC_01638 TaxID=2975982 RepID=UPI00386AAA07|nr:hypothetical protein OG811_18650 [Micromonospora sp. NBC_01638]